MVFGGMTPVKNHIDMREYLWFVFNNLHAPFSPYWLCLLGEAVFLYIPAAQKGGWWSRPSPARIGVLRPRLRSSTGLLRLWFVRADGCVKQAKCNTENTAYRYT